MMNSERNDEDFANMIKAMFEETKTRYGTDALDMEPEEEIEPISPWVSGPRVSEFKVGDKVRFNLDLCEIRGSEDNEDWANMIKEFFRADGVHIIKSIDDDLDVILEDDDDEIMWQPDELILIPIYEVKLEDELFKI